jgi:hypothetical protein
MLEARLKEASNSTDVFPFEFKQFPMPSAKFLKCADINTAEKVAVNFGTDIIFDPSSTLVKNMCPIDELPVERVGEPRLEDAMKYTPGQERDWTYVSSFDDGLFRIDHTGRVLFRRRVTTNNEVQWHAVDRATGQLLELSKLGIQVAKHVPQSRGNTGVLVIHSGVSLPIGVERALTLCAGVTPPNQNGERYFYNVPRSLATEVLRVTLQDTTIN